MNSRAFIIAIEDYGGNLSTLDGPNQDAELFRNWLIEDRSLDEGSIFACAQANWATAGTTRKEIVDALVLFGDTFTDCTDELYFFFSGHGFSYTSSPWAQAADVLVAANFESFRKSGEACLKLLEIQQKLGFRLGPGHHYYFIDACRNDVPQGEIDVHSLGQVLGKSDLGTPSISTLFSTAPGSVARTDKMFGNVLVQGLKGYGRAKGWKGSKMYVTFELLSDYVKKHVRAQEVDYVPGRGPGVLYELSPIPDNACRLEVTGVSAEGSYSGKVMDSRALWRDFEFEGNSFVMNLRPDDYDIELRHPLFEVVRIDPVPPNLLDLYEPTTAKFELKSPDPTKVRAPLGTESTHVEIQTARDVQITLRNLNTGAEVSGFDTIATAVLPGAYEVRGTEGSLTVAKGKFEFQPGANVTIDLLANRTGSTRGSILKVVNENEAARTVPFSESLGRATADWDLGLWLTLMGASRIVDLPENFRKLGKLPLETFYDVRQSDSPVYVLSAFESSAGSPRMALGKSRMVSWRPMNTVSKLDGVYHGVIHQLAGKNFLSIELPSKKAITVPTETFENRATLVVVVEERQVPLRLYQFVLPLGRLARNIDPQVWGLFERLPLPVVRTMFYEQRRFLYADPFEPDTEQAKHLRALIDSPVPDPIMARVACYDLLRDNRAMRAMFPIRDILKRLRKEFGINGDTEAISRLIGMDWTSPDSPPLFLEGLLSFSGETLAGPLSDDKIDYACPWSAWTNAIEAHETPPLTKSAGAGA